MAGFHLDIPITPSQNKMNYFEQLFFMGSCFAEEIAARLHYYKFQTTVNPHGILYDALSISKALERYINNDAMEASALFHSNGLYHSWEHHSRLSLPDVEHALQKINTGIATAHTVLKNAQWLIITLGSSYLYRYTPTGNLVANCHKQPLQLFTKELAPVSEMYAPLQAVLNRLVAFNNKINILLTVSPVRYLRDGVSENNRSKARLIELVHLLTDNKRVFYFPAYELVIDDLRDYRFYKADLVHPNEQAIDYVFEKFKQAFFDEETQQLFDRVEDVMKAKAHKLFYPQLEAALKFKQAYLKRCRQLQEEYPALNLQSELDYFEN